MVAARMQQLQAMHDALDRRLAENRLLHPVTGGEKICVEGELLEIRLVQAERCSLRIADGRFCLALKQPEDDAAVRAAIRQTLSKLALARIRERIAFFASEIGVEFGRVAIRDQKSRWGSCSAKRNLNFNWKLIMAPPQVLDYVVIHELCHLIEFNHSRRFWQLVEKQMPEYEVWKKWLKQHGAELGV